MVIGASGYQSEHGNPEDAWEHVAFVCFYCMRPINDNTFGISLTGNIYHPWCDDAYRARMFQWQERVWS